jgi:transposase InsO family protein
MWRLFVEELCFKLGQMYHCNQYDCLDMKTNLDWQVTGSRSSDPLVLGASPLNRCLFDPTGFLPPDLLRRTSSNRAIGGMVTNVDATIAHVRVPSGTSVGSDSSVRQSTPLVPSQTVDVQPVVAPSGAPTQTFAPSLFIQSTQRVLPSLKDPSKKTPFWVKDGLVATVCHDALVDLEEIFRQDQIDNTLFYFQRWLTKDGLRGLNTYLSSQLRVGLGHALTKEEVDVLQSANVFECGVVATTTLLFSALHKIYPNKSDKVHNVVNAMDTFLGQIETFDFYVPPERFEKNSSNRNLYFERLDQFVRLLHKWRETNPFFNWGAWEPQPSHVNNPPVLTSEQLVFHKAILDRIFKSWKKLPPTNYLRSWQQLFQTSQVMYLARSFVFNEQEKVAVKPVVDLVSFLSAYSVYAECRFSLWLNYQAAFSHAPPDVKPTDPKPSASTDDATALKKLRKGDKGKPSPTPTPTPVVHCPVCGHGGHSTADCRFISHPERNTDTTLAFVESPMGKKWLDYWKNKKENRRHLDTKARLDGTPWSAPSPKDKQRGGPDKKFQGHSNKRKRGESLLCALDCNSIVPGVSPDVLAALHASYCSDGPSPHLMPTLIALPDMSSRTSSHHPVLQINALLDSGSIPHSYISRSIADQLVKAGVKVDSECAHCVRAAIHHESSCSESSKVVVYGTQEVSKHPGICVTQCVTVPIMFLTNKTKRRSDIVLTLGVLDIPYDMIVGRRDIQRYDLTKLCREYFTLPPMDAHEMVTSSPDRHTVLHSLDTVTVPVNEGVPRTVSSVENASVALLALPPMLDSSLPKDLALRNHRELVDELQWLQGLRLVRGRDGGARAQARGASEDTLATSHSAAEDESGPDRKNKGSKRFPLAASLNALGQVFDVPSISDTTVPTRRIQDILGEPGEDAFDEMLESFDISHYTIDADTQSTSRTTVLPDIRNVTFEDGNAEATQAALKLCEEFSTIFSSGYRPEPARVPPMELRVDNALWQRRENALPARVQGVLREAQLRTQIDVLERNNVIRKCPEARHWSQAHLVPKPHPDPVTGEKLWRFTNDFVNLNTCSSTESWPLPIISDMLQRIGSLTPKPRRFAKIDFTHGFHQCSLALSAQIFTAFIVSWALYCWIRVPMGLKGAPSYFQSVMQSALGLLLLRICALYIDDILVWGETNAELLSNLRLVFTKLREHNITVHPHKVFIGLNQLEFVGHVLDGEGLHFTRDKIEKVLAIPLPVFDSEMKSFIGLATYFRDHVYGFAEITAPLHELITQYDKKKKKAVQYTPAALAAFEKIKKEINECPKLYFIDDKLPTFLCTDASDIACGAYLYQVRNNLQIPIFFASRKFTDTEKRWGIPDKESYSCVFGCQKFDYLLRDRTFVLKTDHKNLVHLVNSTSKKVVRWRLALQKYDARIEFIEGAKNVVADALSRMVPADVPNDSGCLASMYMCRCEQCQPAFLNLLVQTTTAPFPQRDPTGFAPGLAPKSPTEPQKDQPDVPTFPRWVLDNETRLWKKAPSIVVSPALVPTQTLPNPPLAPVLSRRKRRVQDAQQLRRTRAAIAVDGEIVRVLEPHERRVLRDLKPSQLPNEVRELLTRVHNSVVGHFGEAMMLQRLAESNHSWPYMRGHVHMFVRDCPLCQKMSQIKPAVVAGRFTTASYQPMERLNIDHQGPFPPDLDGNTHIRAVIDCFSRWIELYPVRSTDAATTAEALIQHIGRFGCPLQLVSDNGSAFVNETIKELTRWLGFEWTYTLAYSKEENAIVERSNKETLRHLRMILNHRKVRNQWSKFTPFVARIFNSSVKERLGVTPGTILFGNALRLDTNIFYFPKGEVPEEERPELSEWIADKLNMQQLAVEVARTTQLELESERFEKEGARPPLSSFTAGSYVLVEDPQTTNKPKLNPLHDGPFEVLGQRGNEVQIKNLINNKASYVHITRVRPFHYDPVVTNPLHIATQDQQEFIVDSILQHRGSPSDKTHMQFLVRWQGYGPESDSWEPWYDAATGAGVRDNVTLHAYLRSKALGYLIPKSQQIPSDVNRAHSSRRK